MSDPCLPELYPKRAVLHDAHLIGKDTLKIWAFYIENVWLVLVLHALIGAVRRLPDIILEYRRAVG